MRIVVKIVKWLLGLAVLAIAVLFAWLYVAPPELIRVGSGYSAKIVCSNVFIAGRDPMRCWLSMCRHPAIRCSS